MSARCYQKKKERPQKKFVKGIKIFLIKRKKNENIVMNNIKIFLKMKKQRLAEYRKKYYKIWENKTA